MAEHTYPEKLVATVGDAVLEAIEMSAMSDPFIAVRELVGVGVLHALVAATGGTKHVVRFERDRYTLQHPITERLDGSLFDCRLDQLIQQLPAAPAVGDFDVHAVDGQLVVGAPARTAEPS